MSVKDLNMYTQSLSINCKQMNGAVNQPPVIPPAKLGDLSVTENGDYPANADGFDGYANVGVEVSGSAKTVINVHCTEDGVVTHDSTMSFDEICAAIEAGNVTFTITDDSRAEYEDPLVYAGSWVYYDYPELPIYFIVATGHTSDSGLSFIFTEDSGRKDYINVPD